MAARNLLGEPLAPCCADPPTGFYRTGSCETGPEDRGAHVIGAQITVDFLEFSRRRGGKDLVTPVPAFGFASLVPGQRRCCSRPRTSGRSIRSPRWSSSDRRSTSSDAVRATAVIAATYRSRRTPSVVYRTVAP
jgi:uncharacterized protein (DUF2237 family)